MPPTFTLALVGAAIAGAAGFGVAWRLQSANIAEMELQSANTRIAAAYVARKAIERSTTAVIVAQNAATDRMVVLHRDADLARSGLAGLRTQSADSLRTAAASLDACVIDATAKTELLSNCAGSLVSVSAAADGHASDTKTLMDAWPR